MSLACVLLSLLLRNHLLGNSSLSAVSVQLGQGQKRCPFSNGYGIILNAAKRVSDIRSVSNQATSFSQREPIMFEGGKGRETSLLYRKKEKEILTAFPRAVQQIQGPFYPLPVLEVKKSIGYCLTVPSLQNVLWRQHQALHFQ